MSISYPQPQPVLSDDKRESTCKLSLQSSAVVVESPFTFNQSTYDYGNERWKLEISFDGLQKTDAMIITSWLSSLRGRVGTFDWNIARLNQNASQVSGTVTATQGSAIDELVLSGLQSSDTIVAGDVIQVGSRLVQIIAFASATSTITITPRISTSASLPVSFVDCTGLFRLDSEEIAIFNIPRNGLFNISFSAVEAL